MAISSQKIQIGFVATLTALTVPIMILNLLGGIISGIWLAILGEWGEIFRGVLIMVVGGFAISIALIPSWLFAAPAAMAIEKGKKLLGMFFGSLSILYTIVLITIWCMWVLGLFVSSANESSLIPLLIWSYGVALAPWMYLSQKDQEGGGNEYSIFTTFFAQTAYILGMILFFLGTTLGAITIIFGIIMLTGGILQVIIAFGGEIKKSFSKKEVKEAFEILEEAGKKFAFASYGFDLVKARAEKAILSEAKQLTKSVQNGLSVKKYVYTLISYISGYLASSGQYHLYRGVLDPMGPGEDLLQIMDLVLDELIASGDISAEEAAKQKEVVRKNIEEMG